MKPILVFQTDFTYKEAAVSAMVGVVKSIDRSLEIVHATHEIPQYDIWSASYRLWQPICYWPEETIFVSVVDPGVGTSRRAVVARTKLNQLIVTPDNGSLTHVAEEVGLTELWVLRPTEKRKQAGVTSNVFHGRDVFAYNAARLASGQVHLAEIADQVDPESVQKIARVKPRKEGSCVIGTAEIADPNFGNLWTNIPIAMLEQLNASVLRVTLSAHHQQLWQGELPLAATFGQAEKNHLLIYQNELGNVALAVNMGSFIDLSGVKGGPDIRIVLDRREDL